MYYYFLLKTHSHIRLHLRKLTVCVKVKALQSFAAINMLFQARVHTNTHSPRGMMERYFPLNLLASVISCLRVQPFSEKA